MRHALTVGLAVLVAVLAALAVQAVRGRTAAQTAAEDRQGAVRAASAHAAALLSLNHRTVDDDMKRVLATSTGPERDGFLAGETTFKAAALKNKVVQTGVIRAGALASVAPDRRTAQALIMADAVIHWEDGRKAAPEERFFRWRMDLAKVAGRWLVARAELVQ